MKRSQTVVVASLTLWCGTAGAHPPFQPLGTLPGYTWSRVHAGGAGQTLVGECGGGPSEAPVRAFIWGWDGQGVQPLGAPSTTIPVEAHAMSFVGLIGGVGDDGSALLWTHTPQSPPMVLPPSGVGGQFEPLATATTGAFVVVGALHTPDHDVPTRWTQSGGYTTIPPLATGEAEGSANAMFNDGSIVVGRMARSGKMGGQAFRWTPAGTVGLGWFSTNGPNPDSTATDLNFLNGNVIVGFSTGGTLAVGAFRYTDATGMIELGALPGAIESRAWGVNDSGAEVVGDCTFPDGHHEAFLWDQWQGMMSLRDVLLACGGVIPPGWTLDEANAWPYSAPVAGNGHDPTGAPAAFAARPRLCYANCDLSTVVPRLSASDFACFLNRFAAGEPYANCDHSTTPPVLNVLDFVCFLDKYVAGCSF